MKKLYETIQYDYIFNRTRLVCETIGSVLYLSGMLYLSLLGNATNFYVFFLNNLVACVLHAINGYMRQSINLVTINLISGIIATIGLYKLVMT